jgi:GNAT superfamily N-acetyltransferase
MSEVVVEGWDAEQTAPLLGLFNRHLAMLPYGGQVSAPQLRRSLLPPAAPFREARLHVSLCDGEPVAVAQTAVGETREGEPVETVGLLRLCLYDRGHRHAAEAVLAAAHDDLRQRGMSRVVAVDRLDYHFFPCCYLPDRWMHVVGLLGEAGYDVRHTHYLMDLEDCDVGEPACPQPGLRTVVEQLPSGVELPAAWIEVFDGDERVAACKMNCFSEWVNGEAAAHTCYTDAFGVHHDRRGLGLARYILQYSLWALHGWGYRRAHLGVRADNHHALLLYDGLGYRTVMTCYLCSRSLHGP